METLLHTTIHTPSAEQRPWGSFIKFADNEKVTVKIITIYAGQEFSLQSHQHRDEFWHVISGDGTVIIGDVSSALVVGGNYEIPVDTKHRIKAGIQDAVIMEISRGEFDEHDITRFEDDYGR